MIRLFAILIPLILSDYVLAQYKLTVIKETQSNKNKQFELGPGSRADISYFKSLSDTSNLPSKTNTTSASGRIKSIRRDTLVLKKFLSGKELTISIHTISQLRKSTNLLVLSGIASGTVAAGYFLSEGTGYFLPAPLQWALPALVYVYLDNKVLNPMKIVHERSQTKKNRWILRIEPNEK